jgi:hypothetical protein
MIGCPAQAQEDADGGVIASFYGAAWLHGQGKQQRTRQATNSGALVKLFERPNSHSQLIEMF